MGMITNPAFPDLWKFYAPALLWRQPLGKTQAVREREAT
jgi:hypothetical protein